MIQRISDRLRKEDKGFTLIELMVVVLIIAILIAIAIPTFLGARKRAQDRAAQSNLRQAVTSGKVIFTDKEDYTNATTGALAAAEPSITWFSAAQESTGPPEVSVTSPDANTFIAAAWSKAGNCWFVRDHTVSDTYAGTMWTKVVIATPPGPVGCNAGAAPNPALPTGWNKDLSQL
jgi:type IV pilus assembly protein PilA